MKLSNSWKHGGAMSEENEIKTVMSCSDVARLVGLSRQRFRQLINAGVFPLPMYDVRTRRPFYTQEMAIQCQDVRRTNMGHQWSTGLVLRTTTVRLFTRGKGATGEDEQAQRRPAR